MENPYRIPVVLPTLNRSALYSAGRSEALRQQKGIGACLGKLEIIMLAP